MNKTITVNIGGMVFYIEEQAYEKMKKYIDTVKIYFKTSEGGDEIMQDVEGRIAEILSERLAGGRQVVNEADIAFVIETMGRPEQFEQEEASETKTAKPSNIEEGRKYRKLYRDADDKIIAGVCSGLSHRLGIDPLWMRLLFIISFFAWGTSLLIYIVLAIIIPKAVSNAQKLEMKGESVNLSSLQKAAAEPAEKKSNLITRFFEVILVLIRVVFKGVFYIVAAFIALIALVILFAIGMTVLAMIGVAGISIPIFISDLFLSTAQQTWAIIALILVLGIPVLSLFFAGIKALFGIKYKSKSLNIAAVLLMITGVIISFWVVTDITRELQTEGKIRNNIQLLTPETDTLFVDRMQDAKYENKASYNHYRIGFIFGRKFTVLSGDNESLIPGLVTLDIKKAMGDQFELVQVNSARGLTEKQAYENARLIQYNMTQKDSLLSFSDYFPITKKTKYRSQRVRLILYVPVGKSVYLTEGTEELLDDLDNVADILDDDMPGHTWTMTEQGLKCLSCDQNPERDEQNDEEIHISNGKNITVKRKGSKTSIRTGDDSLTIRSDDDVKIKIDENGIVIKK
ncbi:MAG: PspC domain-containing protein [Bacteroidia bacterium]|nr:PspC domain-containing protein [Bacteroidia bacterium]MCZ2277384.1 PspC domain-containing protein [Bacteroidia bacterium]